MAKLILAVVPTFEVAVPIPVPGKPAVPVKFTMRGRSREEFQSFLDAMTGKTNAEVIMECATGWELDDPFDAEHVEKLDRTYLGAARAVLDAYMAQVTGARLGN
ncbi:MAG: phage tail assembly chaperone [Candidatus Kapaibacterium sp.]